MKEAGVGTYTFKKGTYFHMPQTLIMLIFNKNLLAQPQKNPQTFGYYIKTENYEVFIPKIAREVHNLEHRKLQTHTYNLENNATLYLYNADRNSHYTRGFKIFM